MHVLLEVVRLISADGHDLDAVLDAICVHGKALLGADAVGVNLTTPEGDLIIRRASPLVPPDSVHGVVGSVIPIGPLTAEALATRRPVVSADIARDPRVVPSFHVLGGTAGSVVGVPLLVADTFQGMLWIDFLEPGRAADVDLELAEALGAHAAAAIRVARLVAESDERLRRLELAQRVSTAVNRATDLDQVLDALLAAAELVTTVPRCAVALVDPDRRYVRGRRGRNLVPGLLEATVRRLYEAPHPDEDMYAVVARTGRQEVFPPDHPARHRPTIESLRAQGIVPAQSVVTPITDGGEVLGVLAVNVGDRAPDVAVLAMLRLIAEQAAGAVARERLRAEARERVLLEGAVKTARALAHEINQHLTVLSTYGDLLPMLVPPGPASDVASAMASSAMALGTTSARLQRIVRFEETDTPVGPALDLDASSRV